MTSHRFLQIFVASGIAFQASTAQTPPTVPLTVGDAVALVLSRNPALVESGHDIDAARARADQSRSGYLPSAEAEATYVLLAPVSVFDLPGESIKVFPYNNYDGHIGVRQTVYDFQKTSAAVGLADSRVAIAEDSREAVKRDLAVRSAETFYAILFLRRSIDVQNEQVRTLQEHLAIAHRKAEAGTATLLDELTTQVRVAAAQNVKIGLENSLRSAEITLRRLAVLPSDAPLQLRGEFPPAAIPPPGTLSSRRLSQGGSKPGAPRTRLSRRARSSGRPAQTTHRPSTPPFCTA